MIKLINKIKSFLFPVKFYDSIENIPMWNYWKIEETSDLKYLAIGKNYDKQFFYHNLKAADAWTKVNGSYLDVFGVSDHYKDILMLKRDIALNEYAWERNREPIARVYAREAKKELEAIQKGDNTRADMNEQIFIIEKEMGFEVDPKVMTIKRFYSYIKGINNLAKKVNKNG